MTIFQLLAGLLFLGSWVGRPFLHKYGKYFFLKEQALDRAEEIFRKPCFSWKIC